MLRIFYAACVEPWLPGADQVAAIGRLLTAPSRVDILPRAQLVQTWASQHPAQPTIEACQVRAWANKPSRRAWLFVDRSETRDSVLWLLGHELAHIELGLAPLLQAAVAAPHSADYLTSDAAHEAHPEERFANQVGAAVLGMLTGRRQALDRLWWRKRARTLAICR